MGTCHSKSDSPPSMSSSTRKEMSESRVHRPIPVALRETKPPPPPYTTTPTSIPPSYLHLEYYPSSTSGSFLLQTNGQPKLLYEIHKPAPATKKQRIPLRQPTQGVITCCRDHKTPPDLQVINMTTSLIVGTVRFNDRVRHGTDAADSPASKTRLGFPRTGMEIMYNHNNKTFRSWYSDESLTWTTESGLTCSRLVLTCTDSQGEALCKVTPKLPKATATIEILRVCETQEQLDEVVVCAVAEVEDVRRLAADLENMLRDSGY